VTTNWEIDQRVLRAVVDAYEPAGNPTRWDAIRAELDSSIDDDTMAGSLRRLNSTGFIVGKGTLQLPIAFVTQVTERGLRASGFWPSTDEAFKDFLARLEEMAAAEPDPVKRRKITDVAQAAASLGKDFAVGVAASVAASGLSGLM
jgi:hypothetical protein